VSVGKYGLAMPFEELWAKAIAFYRFRVLPVEVQHAAVLTTLPYHHKDPFDRMLVAQAIAEGTPLVSCDDMLDAYPIKRLW
jgi:PIN domain nuclease of toxin-antitoxin system